MGLLMAFWEFLKEKYDNISEYFETVFHHFFDKALEYKKTPEVSRPPSPKKKNETTRNEQQKQRVPVKPTQRTCTDCDNVSRYLCVHCNKHFCDTHKDSITCPSCGSKDTMQYFPACSTKGCTETSYDCFLSSCKHIYHRKCLEELFEDITRNSVLKEAFCIYCMEPFTRNHIREDFVLPVVT